MDAKEIKSCLKTARESIRSKDYKEALKQCKAILAVDKSNYNALVFIGVAAEGLEQPDQALKAYKRAAEEHPEQLLAWQGLSSMLDKKEDLLPADEAEKIYSKLVDLNASDSSKQSPYMSRLADLYVKTEQEDKACDLLSKLVVLETDSENQKKWCKMLVQILSPSLSSLMGENKTLFEKACDTLLDGSSDLCEEEVEKYTKLYLVFVSQTNPEKLKAVCEDLKEKYPQAAAPVEILLQCYLDMYIVEGCHSDGDMDTIKALVCGLEETRPSSEMGKVGQAFIALTEGKLLQVRDLTQGVGDECVTRLYFLSKAQLALHCYEQCIEVADRGVSVCSRGSPLLCASASRMASQLKLVQAAAYREVGTPAAQDSAMALLKQVQESFPAQSSLIEAHLMFDQGNLEGAESLVKSLPSDQTAVLRALILCEQGSHSEALALLQSAVEKDPVDPVATMKLGKMLWELRNSKDVDVDVQKCFTTLLKAAKLDPYNYESFLYIGHFYKHIQADAVKARRCYQKAFDLSGGADDPGCALVDMLVSLGEESQSLQILQKVTANAAAGCAKWAWLRLGLHQIKQEDPTTAIMSLQSALRADPNDNHVWECLADAYFHRGSYTAALKAFTKANELDPDSLYCQYQIACIKQTLGSLSEAVTEYKQVLAKSAHYVPVLKGLGESLIQLSKYNMNRCLDGLAQDYMEEALVYLTRAASHRPDLSCLWKLMGDACSLTHCLASDSYSIPSKLMGQGASDPSVQSVSKQQLMEVGARCYSQAVKILPDQSALWHDLAVILYRQSQVLFADADVTTGSAELHRAKQAVQKAISLEPKDWRHWNLLGVIACCKADENLGLAQHCFIKSVGRETSNVVAWSNLGALYLGQSNYQLAHDAFKAAQNVDPTYMACWVGQALIAEVVGHEEAMDLFRHTTELGVHLESAVGYGQWVLKTLRDKDKTSEFFHYCIQQMAAVPAASDALIKYTSRVKTDAAAYNMLGLLLEHQKLYTSAGDAFRTALSLFQAKDNHNQVNDVRLNLARMLRSQGRYEASITEYNQCDLSGQLEHMCHLGLALYHRDQLLDSFKVLEAALEQAGTDRERSQVHAALGMVAYKFQDLDGAKSQLFSSFQTSEPCVQGLLALCALGLLQKDMTLTSAVLEELSKVKDKEKLLKQIALMYLYRLLSQKDCAGGETYMREMVQAHPEESGLWSLLANFILQYSPGQGPAAAECCVTALSLASNLEYCDTMLLQCQAQLLAGHHSRLDARMNALRSAQKAFHSNPGSVQASCSLAGAIHAEAAVRLALNGTADLLGVEHHILTVLLSKDLSTEKRTWLLQLSTINRILANNVDQATASLQLLKQLPEPPVVTKTLEAALASALPPSVSSDHGGPCLSQELALAVLCSQGKFTEAVSMIAEVLKKGEKKLSPTFYRGLLERSAYISYRGLQDSDTSKLKDNFESVVNTLKSKEVTSPVVNILQAARTEDNNRLSKHLFATALDQVESTTDLGYVGSVARQGLVSLLWDSRKESDQELIKALLDDGKSCKDHRLLRLVKQLKERK